MGTLWFFVAYVVRFAVNVLLEPQINPIKHFPVVTVGHKLLLGAYWPFAAAGSERGHGGIRGVGRFTRTIIWCIPGIFGFLVWELKENWRLYAANRRPGSAAGDDRRARRDDGAAAAAGLPFRHPAKTLRQAAAGRTPRPGRRRLAGRPQAPAGPAAGGVVAPPLRRAGVPRIVCREPLLAAGPAADRGNPPGHELRAAGSGATAAADAPLRIAIDAESGWLLAGVSSPGWAERLPPHQRQMLTTALLGLYKTAGVDLVRQQIESEFPPPVPQYDVSAEGLVLWPDEKEDVEVLYDLHEGPWIAPQSVRGLARRRLPTVERQRILFSEVPVAWQRWVEAWEQDLAGQGHPRDPVAPVRVLP